jgi:hypothetical protein
MANESVSSDVERILQEIDKLDSRSRQELYRQLKGKRRSSEEAMQRAMKYRGVAKHYWGKDAQEYVNQIRDNDRL